MAGTRQNQLAAEYRTHSRGMAGSLDSPDFPPGSWLVSEDKGGGWADELILPRNIDHQGGGESFVEIAFPDSHS